MNSKKTESIHCDHSRLVVMSRLTSGADGKKFQHVIENSSGSLILVIQGKLNPGDSLKETFDRIMNSFQSAQGKTNEIGANVSFILKDPAEKTIMSAKDNAGQSKTDHSIAARGAVNWANNQVGLQSAITACQGLKAMNTANVPKDEIAFIAFLNTCDLPETLSGLALIHQILLARRENGYDSSVNVNWANNQVGLQSAITACQGLKAMNTANVPKDEIAFIAFLNTQKRAMQREQFHTKEMLFHVGSKAT